MYVWGYMGTAVNMDVVILGCRYAEIQGYKEIVICKICASGIELGDRFFIHFANSAGPSKWEDRCKGLGTKGYIRACGDRDPI